MTLDELKNLGFDRELVFTATRSSGAGGQNVNKVNTRVELRFHVGSSSVLTEEQKMLIGEKLGNRISLDGYLIIVSQEGRSQLENRKRARDRFYTLIYRALTPSKRRIPTRATRASGEKRLRKKKILSAIKKLRREKPGFSAE